MLYDEFDQNPKGLNLEERILEEFIGYTENIVNLDDSAIHQNRFRPFFLDIIGNGINVITDHTQLFSETELDMKFRELEGRYFILYGGIKNDTGKIYEGIERLKRVGGPNGFEELVGRLLSPKYERLSANDKRRYEGQIAELRKGIRQVIGFSNYLRKEGSLMSASDTHRDLCFRIAFIGLNGVINELSEDFRVEDSKVKKIINLPIKLANALFSRAESYTTFGDLLSSDEYYKKAYSDLEDLEKIETERGINLGNITHKSRILRSYIGYKSNFVFPDLNSIENMINETRLNRDAIKNKGNDLRNKPILSDYYFSEGMLKMKHRDKNGNKYSLEDIASDFRLAMAHNPDNIYAKIQLARNYKNTVMGYMTQNINTPLFKTTVNLYHVLTRDMVRLLRNSKNMNYNGPQMIKEIESDRYNFFSWVRNTSKKAFDEIVMKDYPKISEGRIDPYLFTRRLLNAGESLPNSY